MPKLSKQKRVELVSQHAAITRVLSRVFRAPVAKMSSGDLHTTQKVTNVSLWCARYVVDGMRFVTVISRSHHVVSLQVPISPLDTYEPGPKEASMDDELAGARLQSMPPRAAHDGACLWQCQAPERPEDEAGGDRHRWCATCNSNFKDISGWGSDTYHNTSHVNSQPGAPAQSTTAPLVCCCRC